MTIDVGETARRFGQTVSVKSHALEGVPYGCVARGIVEQVDLNEGCETGRQTIRIRFRHASGEDRFAWFRDDEIE